jgi:hypothetical protein
MLGRARHRKKELSLNQRGFFEGGPEKPHRLSRGEKLAILDRIVLPKLKGTTPGSLLVGLRAIDSFCGNWRHCVVGRDKLAGWGRLKVRQMQSILNVLEELGLVRIENRSDRDGHRTASRYIPDWDRARSMCPPESEKKEEARVQPLHSGAAEPECNGCKPECNGCKPECNGCTALDPSSDPSKDPPPPLSPKASEISEGGGGGGVRGLLMEYFAQPAVVADTLERFRVADRLFERLAEAGQYGIAAGDRREFFAFLVSVDRERKRRRLTPKPVHAPDGLALWRLEQGRRFWTEPITREDREKATTILARLDAPPLLPQPAEAAAARTKPVSAEWPAKLRRRLGMTEEDFTRMFPSSRARDGDSGDPGSEQR